MEIKPNIDWSGSESNLIYLYLQQESSLKMVAILYLLIDWRSLNFEIILLKRISKQCGGENKLDLALTVCGSFEPYFIQLVKGGIQRVMEDFVNTLMKILHDKEISDFLNTE
jgi:hypothetical protein